MKKRKGIARKLHKWPGLIVAFFLLFFSVSGVFLNHRDLISNIDIPRKWIPSSYNFDNWNLATARASFTNTGGQTFLYGNSGIWKTDSLFSQFTDFTTGLPQSADRLKTYAMEEHKGLMYAGTHYGLYAFNDGWQKIKLPVDEQRIVDLIAMKNTLYVLTRSHVLRRISGAQELYEVVELPAPEGYKRELSLFKTLWDIHSGEFLGLPGRLFVDLMGVVTFILSLTGIIFFLNPRFRKKFKSYRNNFSKKMTRYSLHYHNWLGNYTFVFIGIIALTGMFLRPPLLIPIANTTVPVIPYTHYDSPNPWFDKLRAMLHDEEKGEVLFSTSEGMFRIDDSFTGEMEKFTTQPVVSVMGITVFKKLASGDYLVGSFSGLYRWMPARHYVYDLINQQPAGMGRGMGNPFGGTAVAGFVVDANGNPFLFDYDRGVGAMGHNARFGEMPEELAENGRISLWNTSLEVHTGRIYSAILGSFYILIVPITGLVTLMVLISGYIIYQKRYKRKNLKKPNK